MTFNQHAGINTRIAALHSHAEFVEYSLPMLCFKTDEEMTQIKRFVAVYYKPLLTQLEIEQLKLDVPEFKPMETRLELDDKLLR